MCGRFVITGDPFGIGFKDNFNITPGTKIPIKTLDSDGELKTWSYSPLWKTDMNLINCRYETMNLKPSFKEAKSTSLAKGISVLGSIFFADQKIKRIANKPKKNNKSFK